MSVVASFRWQSELYVVGGNVCCLVLGWQSELYFLGGNMCCCMF